MMQKFTYFYIEVLQMFFSIVESASAKLPNAQLDFCKALDITAGTKVSITSARNDARFNCVWSRILSATEANDVIN